MYVETDFLLALLKDDDWLQEPAKNVYREHREELWTREYTLIELMLVAYREDRNVLKTVAGASKLVEIRGEESLMKEAASYVTENGLTPMDAVHLASSGEDKILSSEKEYQDLSEVEKLDEK
ncbi:MAG: type II toxin-antitoxin system VapC family toxin [Candidatus Nanohalobium sp.]